MIFLERGIAWVLLLLMLPAIVFIYFTVFYFAGEPVITADSLQTEKGNVKSFRFRTTGPGKSAFHRIGRFLRLYGLDELPALWSVIQGTVRLKDVLPFIFK